MQCQKFDGVRWRASQLLSDETPPSPASREAVHLGVLRAAAKTRLQTGKEALRRILPQLDARPRDVGLLLTVVQLYLQARNPTAAVALVEAFFKRLDAPADSDVRFAPGLVALAAALYRLQGRAAAARAELARAAAHWRSRDDAAPGPALLRDAGVALLHSPDPADLAAAAASFAQLAEASAGTDRAAAAGLVASLATTDYARAEPHLAALTPVERLTHGIDAAALLAGGVAAAPAAPAAPASKKRGAADDRPPDAARGAARKRRRRLPKDYDPDRKPDPERWLPLRDRSSYRPKGKKGKKRAAEATQGGAVKAGPEEETLELAGGAGSVRVEKAGGPGAVGSGTSGGGGKKKKGKK